MKFYSQFGEDKWIYENTNLPRRGTIIDVGAYDGIQYSNSLFFENLGWYGLLIEPNVEMKPFLMANRKMTHFCPYAIDLEDENRELIVDGAFSRLENINLEFTSQAVACIKTVRCISLDTLILNFDLKNIDILSIDTEGNDLRVWESLTRLRPKIVIVEHKVRDEASTIDQLLERADFLGYSLRMQTTCNLIFTDNLNKSIMKVKD